MSTGEVRYVKGTTPAGKSERTARIARNATDRAINVSILSATQNFMADIRLDPDGAREIANRLTQMADTIEYGEQP